VGLFIFIVIMISAPPARTRPRGHAQNHPPHSPFTHNNFKHLLDLLFRILFSFRSRYLFAIGLPLVFSLARNVPRALSCNLKQLDSKTDSPLGPSRIGPSATRLSLSRAALSNATWRSGPEDPRRDGRQTTRRTRLSCQARFSCWALPSSLAVTGGIAVAFFSCP